MTKLVRVLLLLAVLGLLVSNVARAQDVVPDEAEEAVADVDDVDVVPEMEDVMPRPISVCRAIFPNCSSPVFPTLPAGSKAESVLVYQNNDEGNSHTVVLVIGYIQPLNNYAMVIQNFSVVRQARAVAPGETTSFRYSFTPSPMLEPGDYNLVLGLYFQNGESNSTYFITGFNGTVTIDESLGTDPRTVLTYFTLLGIFAAAAYFTANHFGLIAKYKAMQAKKAGAAQRSFVEVGTSGEGYDADYVSEEHKRYREEVLRKGSSSPSGRRQASSSPNKKKK